MDEINTLRKKINHIDDQLMALLEERFNYTNHIGKLKQQNNTAIVAKDRETFIFNKIQKYTHSRHIKNIYKFLMDESKKAQRNV
ncbi:MAG: chorismate mutase [Candidatus Izimaplasma sp.]|nr:chorismate mutase [Candidatus Izimaplasma bacterium]